MQVRQFRDIVAFHADAKSAPVAFHATRLEVAELSAEAWGHFEQTKNQAAEQELLDWSLQPALPTETKQKNYQVSSLTINVTQICNLHCTYCAAGGDGTYGDPVKVIAIQKTLPQIEYFMKNAPRGSRFHIAFLGGEPLLYPKAIQALGEYALHLAAELDLKLTFKVTTNGTLIDREVLQALTSLKASVVVSLDGPQEINDRQRVTKSGKGSFAAALSGLQKLLEHQSQLGAIGVHSVFNDQHTDVVATWKAFADLPVRYFEFTYSVDHHNPQATKSYCEALEQVAALAFAKGGEAELCRINNFAEIFRRLDRQEPLTNHCGIGKSLAVIDARNHIYNCPWTVGKPSGLLGSQTTINEAATSGFQDSLIELNNCHSCWARFLCGGGCSYVHGSTNGQRGHKKIDFCDRTRFQTGLAIVYYHRARGGEQC